VLDYARSYALDAVVFRMSCIYGPHQMGCEDQGWVAHFMIRALQGLPITLYGDGLQVRDILYVDDVVRALRVAQQQSRKLAGRAFTIGGGPENVISLNELISIIGGLNGRAPQVKMADWRVGDQRYFAADTTAFRRETGWAPRIRAEEGIRMLYQWLREHGEALGQFAPSFGIKEREPCNEVYNTASQIEQPSGGK
jgi:CDP-paratose 2-epimerase